LGASGFKNGRRETRGEDGELAGANMMVFLSTCCFVAAGKSVSASIISQQRGSLVVDIHVVGSIRSMYVHTGGEEGVEPSVPYYTTVHTVRRTAGTQDGCCWQTIFVLAVRGYTRNNY